MDEKLKEIRGFLVYANGMFPNLKFRCGYGATNHTYIVEVKPLSEFDHNEEYARMELQFTDSFENWYKDMDLIFVSDNDLCRIEEVLFMIGYDDDPQFVPNKLNFDFDFDLWMTENNDNYTLAA